ncbi:uncharacterized protein [Linepithema humile]
MWAHVFLTKTKTHLQVQIKDILKFDLDRFDDSEEAKRKVFYIIHNRQKTPCQVTKIAESKEELLQGKRVRIPKLNYSDAETSNNNSSDKEKELSNQKKSREAKEKSSSQINQNILMAYLKSMEKYRKNNEESKMQHSIERNIHRENSQKKLYSKDLVECREELEHCQEKLHLCQLQLEETAEKEKQWSVKYAKLKESKVFPLTEATGQQIVDLLLQLKLAKGRTLPHQHHVANSDISIMDNNNEDDNFIIPKEVYNEIMREKDNGKVLNTLSYAAWGIEILANRVVRSAVNTPYKELTPQKKAAVVNMYERWLRETRKLPEHIINEEVERRKINERFNKAITGARKKLRQITDKKTMTEEASALKEKFEKNLRNNSSDISDKE